MTLERAFFACFPRNNTNSHTMDSKPSHDDKQQRQHKLSSKNDKSREGKKHQIIKMMPFFVFLLISTSCNWRFAAAMTSTPQSQSQSQQSLHVTSEGSLRDMQISPTMASKPGSTPGFYNPKRRIGRDFVVLSVAHWLATEATTRRAPPPAPTATSSSEEKDELSSRLRPARLLDATCATGIQGLRTVVESPILARAILSKKTNDHHTYEPPESPELQVVLNDMDADAIELANHNVNSVRLNNQELDFNINVAVTQRVAQALMHEETFEVSVLDPFGSVQPFLDAALARAPQGGLIEVCATDVGVLYGTRPSIAARHYHAHLAHKRPPCYRERGVRLLFAAIAQAAGRHDRGVVPVYGISTEHFCLVSVKVLRGAKVADSTAKQVRSVRICRTCGAVGTGSGRHRTKNLPSCECEPIDGAGTDAQEEGPLWVGPLHDVEAVKRMAKIACLPQAKELISKETCTFLQKLQEEAAVDCLFHRRPGVAARGRTPKLTTVMEELQNRGFKAARTHFCVKSLKTDASAKEFDDTVKAILAHEDQS
jgi:tRNA (guanine26-N2/guanine27-N2)-dimethyltransferase